MPEYVVQSPPVTALPVAGEVGRFQSAAFTASDVTMPLTPSKWGTIQIVNRLSSSRKTPTIWIHPASFPIRPKVQRCASRSGNGGDAQVRCGTNIPDRKGAMDCVYGYAASLDMTRRDLQGVQEKSLVARGRSARRSKRSAPIGPDASRVSSVGQSRSRGFKITLTVNGDDAPGGRPQPDDLEGARADFLPVRLLRAGSWRCHSVRYAVGCSLRFRKGDVMEVAIEGLGSLTVKVV